MASLLRLFAIAAFFLLPMLLVSCDDKSVVEIYFPETQPPPYETVIIEGSVNLPGVYPMKSGDTIEDLLRAAGGATGGSTVKLTVGDTQMVAQKVNLNTADAWLLTALPGVGDAKASAIVDYRAVHGPFINIMELTKVPGFGQALFDSLRDRITVSD